MRGLCFGFFWLRIDCILGGFLYCEYGNECVSYVLDSSGSGWTVFSGDFCIVNAVMNV